MWATGRIDGVGQKGGSGMRGLKDSKGSSGSLNKRDDVVILLRHIENNFVVIPFTSMCLLYL